MLCYPPLQGNYNLGVKKRHEHRCYNMNDEDMRLQKALLGREILFKWKKKVNFQRRIHVSLEFCEARD